MKWAWPLFVLALVAAPALAWGVARLAKDLGFLDPPWNAEHEERRTIIASLYALLLFLCVFLYGFAASWPRVWIVFGVANALALVFFATIGLRAVRRLWRLRHPAPEAPPAAAAEPAVAEDPGTGGSPS
jgi:hypothetical protein